MAIWVTSAAFETGTTSPTVGAGGISATWRAPPTAATYGTPIPEGACEVSPSVIRRLTSPTGASRHGAIHDDGEHVVVTPMVSAYAWASETVKDAHFDFEHSACGTPYVETEGADHYLSFDLSACARSRLGN